MFLFNAKNKIIARQSVDLQLRPSLVHGKGVFCKKKFCKGELIEVAPLIRGTTAEYKLLSQTELHDYYFILEDKEAPLAIGLGFASWFNHACPANAEYTISKKNNTIIIQACRDIEAGTEITINYHGDPNNNQSIEFTPLTTGS